MIIFTTYVSVEALSSITIIRRLLRLLRLLRLPRAEGRRATWGNICSNYITSRAHKLYLCTKK